MSDHELTEDEIIERYKETEYIEERMRPIPEERTCVWSLDADSVWRGACGVVWVFEDSSAPKDHGMNYCPRCGARLETQQPKESK